MISITAVSSLDDLRLALKADKSSELFCYLNTRVCVNCFLKNCCLNDFNLTLLCAIRLKSAPPTV